MLPKFDNYCKAITEDKHKKKPKKGMSTGKKVAIGLGGAAAVGGLGYHAGKKLGGVVGAGVGKARSAAAEKIAQIKALRAAAKSPIDTTIKVTSNVSKAGVSSAKDQWSQLKGMARAFFGLKDKGYETPTFSDPRLRDLSTSSLAKGTDVSNAISNIPSTTDKQAIIDKAKKTGAAIGGTSLGIAGAAAGGTAAHLATKDKKKKSRPKAASV